MQGKTLADIEMAEEGRGAVHQSVVRDVLKRGALVTDSRSDHLEMMSKSGSVIGSVVLVGKGEQVRGTAVDGRKNGMEGIGVIGPQGTMDVFRTGTKRQTHDAVPLPSMRWHLSRMIVEVVTIGVAEEAKGGMIEVIDGIAAAWDARGIAATNLLHTET